MSSQNPNPQVTQNPFLLITEISDIRLRQNFKNLQAYFIANNQMLGFVFFEQVFTAAKANFTLAHGLKSVPLDVIVTQVTGAGQVTFNFGLFDATNINMTVTGACRVRFFVGTYYNFTSSVVANKSDAWTVNPSTGGNASTLATQAASSTTVTLTNTSASAQWFTGTGNQTVLLPDATTCTVGQTFTIYNKANGILYLKDTALNVLVYLFGSASSGRATVACLSNSTKAGTWGLDVAQGPCYYIAHHSLTVATMENAIWINSASAPNWVDFVSTGNVAPFVQDQNVNFGSVNAITDTSGRALPQIKFSWPATGYYRISAQFGTYASHAEVQYRLTDGTTGFEEGTIYTGNSDTMAPFKLQTIVKVTAIGAPVTYKIQMSANGTTGYIGYGINRCLTWTIERLGDL